MSTRHHNARVKWRQLSVRLLRCQQCYCSDSLWTSLAISTKTRQHHALMFGSGLPNFTHFGDAAEAHCRHHGLSMPLAPASSSMPPGPAPDPSAPNEEAEYAPLLPQSSAQASSSMMLAGAFAHLPKTVFETGEARPCVGIGDMSKHAHKHMRSCLSLFGSGFPLLITLRGR